MRAVVVALILAAGVVNLLPAVGAISAGRIRSLYGVAIEDPNLAILMRHRAVLFAIIGALLLASAFEHALRPVAFAAGFVSMGSFVLLALRVGDLNPALRRIVLIDVVASVGLLIAFLLDLRDPSSGF
jgi:hypothetical protein